MSGFSSSFLSLSFEKENIDVGLDSSSLDCGVHKELVELIVSSDSLLNVLRSYSLSLLLLAVVPSNFHQLSYNILNAGG